MNSDSSDDDMTPLVFEKQKKFDFNTNKIHNISNSIKNTPSS